MSKGHTVSVAAFCAQTEDQSLPIFGPHEEHHETTAASTGNLARKRAMSGCNRMERVRESHSNSRYPCPSSEYLRQKAAGFS
jgi:hypothetical protein